MAVIPGVDGRKMSKSYDNTVELFGSESRAKKRIMSMKTDSTPGRGVEGPRTSATSLALLKLMASAEEIKDWEAR